MRRILTTIQAIRVSRVYTRRNIAKAFKNNPEAGIYDGRVELDTHADTFVAGRNCVLMAFTEQVCDVMPYSDDYQPKKGIPIVTAATGYTAANGRQFILVFNEAL